MLPVDVQLDWIAYSTYDKYNRITKVSEVYGTSVQRADARHAQSAEVPLLLIASSDGTVGCRPALVVAEYLHGLDDSVEIFTGVLNLTAKRQAAFSLSKSSNQCPMRSSDTRRSGIVAWDFGRKKDLGL